MKKEEVEESECLVAADQAHRDASARESDVAKVCGEIGTERVGSVMWLTPVLKVETDRV